MLNLKMWTTVTGLKLEIVIRKWQSNYQKEKVPTKYVKLKKIEIVDFGVDR